MLLPEYVYFLTKIREQDVSKISVQEGHRSLKALQNIFIVSSYFPWLHGKTILIKKNVHSLTEEQLES